MKRFAYSLAILASCAGFHAQAGDNPPPSLLAKIQLATQVHQDAGREFKDLKKFARENEPALDGGNGGVSTKKVGSLDVSKSRHTPGAIGKAIGNHANDGDEER